ncbi:DNA polymerase III subunit chi [Klebsiella pneumoniae]|uniref:DNA polymerase III subunit chi n=1 Tax=Klebsiella pneumoniae TaxID=573 RepID=A0A3S5DHR6_KLEPN|nr:DNA polymerase III subunit chi [Klebsiella pneumoniae]
MKNATFYLLDNDATVDGLEAPSSSWCVTLPQNVGATASGVLIACEDEQQAIRLDEALWSRPPERLCAA